MYAAPEADASNGFGMLPAADEQGRAAVPDDVVELRIGQPRVEWHQREAGAQAGGLEFDVLELVFRQVRDPVAGREAPRPEGGAEASGAIVNLRKRESVLSTHDSGRVGLSQRRTVHQVDISLDGCRHEQFRGRRRWFNDRETVHVARSGSGSVQFPIVARVVSKVLRIHDPRLRRAGDGNRLHEDHGSCIVAGGRRVIAPAQEVVLDGGHYVHLHRNRRGLTLDDHAVVITADRHRTIVADEEDLIEVEERLPADDPGPGVFPAGDVTLRDGHA